MNRFAQRLRLFSAMSIALWCCTHTASAALTNVNIVDFAFTPSKVRINPSDQVKWTWQGAAPHSTTSNGGVWDSGIHDHGFVFTNTFNTEGAFPYVCTVHPNMTGSVTVGSATNGTPPTTAVLVVQINGNGTVSPNLNGQMLTLGKSFTMTAKPAAGAIFANWSGSSSATTPTLTFVMQSNLVFTANFVPSPFGAANSTYNGLFLDPDNVSLTTAGGFTLALTPTGKFTAKMQQGKSKLSLKGQFSGDGSSSNVVVRMGQSPLTVRLQLDMADTDRLTGTVNDGTHTVNLVADRATFDGRQRMAPQAGLYTMIIAGEESSHSVPAGDSVATVAVDSAGKIKLTGSLADGTKITQASAVSKNGDWPFFVSLYAGQGLIVGWLSFENNAGNAIQGNIVWLKAPQAAAKFYPAGFNFSTSASGSPYHPPAAGNNVVNFTAGTVTLSGGNLNQPLVNHISIGANNKVTNLDTNKLTLTFKSTTGTFTGKVLNPGTTQTFTFNGVVLQGIGQGYFLGTSESGEAAVGP